ncbi:MAG: sulfotransferase domain-containing protein [Pseudomonadota bacterium]
MTGFAAAGTTFKGIAIAWTIRGLRAAGLGDLFLRKLTSDIVEPSRPRPVYAQYKPAPGDVFVVSYPRSGTNWMLQACIETAACGRGEFDHIHDVVPWPESPFGLTPRLEDASRYPLKVVKVFSPPEHLTWSPDAKYVSLIRDPRDVFPSMFKFACGTFGLDGHVSMEAFSKLFLPPGNLAAAWARTTAYVWNGRSEPNRFVRTYSEMRRGGETSLNELIDFLEVDLSADERTAVAERASIEWMRANEARFAPPDLPLGRGYSKAKLVDAGRVGSGADLPDGMAEQIAEFCIAELARLRSDFPFEEKFGR